MHMAKKNCTSDVELLLIFQTMLENKYHLICCIFGEYLVINTSKKAFLHTEVLFIFIYNKQQPGQANFVQLR